MADRDQSNNSGDQELGGDLTKPANIATILSYKVNRRILVITAVGVAVTIIALFVSCSGSGGGDTTTVSGDGNNIDDNSGARNEASSGACAQFGDNNTCLVQLQEDVEKTSEETATDEQFKIALAKKSTDEPVEPGPWPYVVVDTVEKGLDLGLWARSTNDVKGDHVGIALNHNIVWADCVAASSYSPVEGTPNDVGPKWLRVRWPNDQLSERLMHSNPSNDKRAWMYLGYTVPMYHNGNILACAS